MIEFLRDPNDKNAMLRAAFEHATMSYRRKLGVYVEKSFGEWLYEARPDYDWTAPHFRVMQERLDRVTQGKLRRVFFSVPIRHGKTEHNSISYAAYRLERDPTFRWLVGSYNARQAEKISREIRKLARARGVEISKERDTSAEWETTSGGGVRAVGSGAGVASVNADGIIIDDPIGSRQDAESQANRDVVWDWISNDLLARCEPHTFVLFTMSRWHIDDPAGRIMDKQRDMWDIVDLPGRAEENDLLGRRVGEVLWAALRDDKWMNEKRIELGDYGFASLIQGRPRPREGGMFKWSWWQLIDSVPLVGPMVRYVDPAGTEPKGKKSDPDYTATALLTRMPDQRTAIVDVTAFQKSVAQRDAMLVEICKKDVQNYLMKGRQICWWLEQEVGIAGSDRTRELVLKLQNTGMPVYTEHATGNKTLRAEPLASKAEAGNVVLCPGSWRDPFRTEAADFPNGMHDDMVDSAAGADSKLSVPLSTVGFQTLRI